MSNEVATTGTGKSLTVFDEAAKRFMALNPESEIKELLAENLADGETLGLGSLTRVGNPSGKALTFTLPDIETGRDKPVEELEGIIIAFQDGRAYFETEQVSDNPPDCSSRDGVHGFGMYGKDSEENPSGLCADCPMGQWLRGTGENEGDVPPPCKPHTKVLLLTEDEMFPLLVRVPRTSQKNFRDYRRALLKKGKGVAGVTTKIGLERAKSSDNTDYAKMTFRMGEPFDRATKTAALAFGEEMKANVLNALPPGELEYDPEFAKRGGVSIDGEVVENGGASIGEPDADTLAEYESGDRATS